MNRISETATPRGFAAAALAALALGACASVPQAPPACLRLELDPAPPWTASVTWAPGEEELVLVDPGTRRLATYDREGHRTREIDLGERAEIDFSHPLRLERDGSGFVLIDRQRALRLDRELRLARIDEPGAGLEALEISGLSLNDSVAYRGKIVGYADFVDETTPSEDPKATGAWRRGFARVDPKRAELDLLLELPLEENGEYLAYYLYDRRPYVTKLGGEVYVLRYTVPWTLTRVRGGGLETVATGPADDAGQARALYGWRGRLYVLTRDREAVADAGGEPTEPVLQNVAQDIRAELVEAMRALPQGRSSWTLHEIDPAVGRVARRLVLPTAAARLSLVPGRGLWAAIEETSAPNLEDGESEGETTLMLLPASELESGRFGCRPREPAHRVTPP